MSLRDSVVVPALPGVFVIPWRAYARSLTAMQVLLVSIVAEESLGRGRAWAPLSIRQLADALCAPPSSVRYALRTLRDRHGVLEWRRGDCHGAPNRYRVAAWSSWKRWRPDVRASAIRLLHRLVLGDDFPLHAIRMAEHLRLLSLRVAPSTPVPVIDPSDAVWLRWCRSMRDLLRESRMSLPAARDLLDYAERVEVERARLVGENADRLLAVRWRVLHAAMVRTRELGVL